MGHSRSAFFQFKTREAQLAAAREMNLFSNVFMSADPDDVGHGALSRRVHFLKREKEGEDIMCKISEGFIQEGEREGLLEAILNLMSTTKWDVEKAMEALRIEPDERQTYAAFVKAALAGKSA